MSLCVYVEEPYIYFDLHDVSVWAVVIYGCKLMGLRLRG